MSYREFVVPSDAEILDTFGVESEPADDAPTTRILHLANGEETLTVTFDILGRSVHFIWSRGATVVLEVYREAATRLSVSSGGGVAELTVTFETDQLAGEITLQVFPSISIHDQLLFQ